MSLPASRSNWLTYNILLVFAAVLVAGCGGDDAGPGGGHPAEAGQAHARPKMPPQAPIAVAVESAARGTIASHYAATATLDPNKQADILSRVSGVVEDITAEEGDLVRAGDVLLHIQDDEFRFRLKQAQADEATQKTKFERLKKMIDGKLISADEYETAENDMKSAEAARELAELELSYTRVDAPFRGRVVRRYVDPGQTVNNGTALFQLADMSRLLARVHVPAREFRKIQTDQPVELVLDSTGDRLTGRIDLVSPVIDPTSGTIKVTVEVDEYPEATRPGDFAEVRIVTERRDDVLLVPRISVVTEKGERVVYVAAPDSTADRRVVEVGFEDEDHAQILSGVETGEPVVVQGQRSLKHGAPLKVMDAMRFEDEQQAGD